LRFPGPYFDVETGKHYNYFRDYDPAIGRYLESDPIGLVGGPNGYVYVASSPLRKADKQGLIGYDPPEPASEDAGWPVCNGRGGVTIQYPLMDEKQKRCYGDCIREHETVHIIDFRKTAPTVCKNIGKNWIPYFDTKGEASASERRAYDAELRCLLAKLKGLSDCNDCKPVVEKRINDVRTIRKDYE
jgi:RHS repeat-associated protein